MKILFMGWLLLLRILTLNFFILTTQSWTRSAFWHFLVRATNLKKEGTLLNGNAEFGFGKKIILTLKFQNYPF